MCLQCISIYRNLTLFIPLFNLYIFRSEYLSSRRIVTLIENVTLNGWYNSKRVPLKTHSFVSCRAIPILLSEYFRYSPQIGCAATQWDATRRVLRVWEYIIRRGSATRSSTRSLAFWQIALDALSSLKINRLDLARAHDQKSRPVVFSGCANRTMRANCARMRYIRSSFFFQPAARLGARIDVSETGNNCYRVNERIDGSL